MKKALLALLLITFAFVGWPHVASADAMQNHHLTMVTHGDCTACPGKRMAHEAGGCANAFGCAVFIVPAAGDLSFAADLIDGEPAQQKALRLDTPYIPLILPPPQA